MSHSCWWAEKAGTLRSWGLWCSPPPRFCSDLAWFYLPQLPYGRDLQRLPPWSRLENWRTVEKELALRTNCGAGSGVFVHLDQILFGDTSWLFQLGISRLSPMGAGWHFPLSRGGVLGRVWFSDVPGCHLAGQGLLLRSPTSVLCTSPPTAVRAPSGVPTHTCPACCGLGTQVLGLSESVLIVDQTVLWESQGPPCVKSSAC